MARPWRISVTRLRRRGDVEEIHIDAPAGDLFVTGSEVPAGAHSVLDGTLDPGGGTVMLRATVSAPWTGPCRRCLTQVTGRLVAPIDELFEDDPIEDETWPIVHDEIDLEPLMREAILVELPEAPLCREDCAGLCATCGVDRNEATCSCVPPADPRWAVLDELRSDND